MLAVVKVSVTTIGTREDLVALIMETVTGKKSYLEIDKLIEVLDRCNDSGFTYVLGDVHQDLLMF